MRGVYLHDGICQYYPDKKEGVMSSQSRKTAVAAFKARAPAHGVFAVICRATGEAWVGRSQHVDVQRNGIWFALRLGTSPFASLQAAWRAHGEDAFTYEELERLRDDFPDVARAGELKARQALWQARLHASAI
jgi:hypothetical protein